MNANRTKLAATIPAATTELEPLLSTDGIAHLLGCGRRTVERLRAAGTLPKPCLRVGSLPRWRPAVIREWIERQTGTN
jgi:excisionase family DNA binding protein